jgi:hypoxanthine phosphoribosyltransferase
MAEALSELVEKNVPKKDVTSILYRHNKGRIDDVTTLFEAKLSIEEDSAGLSEEGDKYISDEDKVSLLEGNDDNMRSPYDDDLGHPHHLEDEADDLEAELRKLTERFNSLQVQKSVGGRNGTLDRELAEIAQRRAAIVKEIMSGKMPAAAAISGGDAWMRGQDMSKLDVLRSDEHPTMPGWVLMFEGRVGNKTTQSTKTEYFIEGLRSTGEARKRWVRQGVKWLVFKKAAEGGKRAKNDNKNIPFTDFLYQKNKEGEIDRIFVYDKDVKKFAAALAQNFRDFERFGFLTETKEKPKDKVAVEAYGRYYRLNTVEEYRLNDKKDAGIQTGKKDAVYYRNILAAALKTIAASGIFDKEGEVKKSLRKEFDYLADHVLKEQGLEPMRAWTSDRLPKFIKQVENEFVEKRKHRAQVLASYREQALAKSDDEMFLKDAAKIAKVCAEALNPRAYAKKQDGTLMESPMRTLLAIASIAMGVTPTDSILSAKGDKRVAALYKRRDTLKEKEDRRIQIEDSKKKIDEENAQAPRMLTQGDDSLRGAVDALKAATDLQQKKDDAKTQQAEKEKKIAEIKRRRQEGLPVSSVGEAASTEASEAEEAREEERRRLEEALRIEEERKRAEELRQRKEAEDMRRLEEEAEANRLREAALKLQEKQRKTENKARRAEDKAADLEKVLDDALTDVPDVVFNNKDKEYILRLLKAYGLVPLRKLLAEEEAAAPELMKKAVAAAYVDAATLGLDATAPKEPEKRGILLSAFLPRALMVRVSGEAPTKKDIYTFTSKLIRDILERKKPESGAGLSPDDRELMKKVMEQAKASLAEDWGTALGDVSLEPKVAEALTEKIDVAATLDSPQLRENFKVICLGLGYISAEAARKIIEKVDVQKALQSPEVCENLRVLCLGLTHLESETAGKLVEKADIEAVIKNRDRTNDFAHGICRALSWTPPQIADSLVASADIGALTARKTAEGSFDAIDNFVKLCSHLKQTYSVPEKILVEEFSAKIKGTDLDKLMEDAAEAERFVLELDKDLTERMAAILGKKLAHEPQVDFAAVLDNLPATYELFFGGEIAPVKLSDHVITVSAQEGRARIEIEKDGKKAAACGLLSYGKNRWEITSVLVNETFKGRGYSMRLLDLCKRIAEKYGAEEVTATSATVAGFILYHKAGFLPARHVRDGVEVDWDLSDELDDIIKTANSLETRRDRIWFYNAQISGLMKDPRLFNPLVKTPGGFFVYYPKGRTAPSEAEKAAEHSILSWMLFDAAKDAITELADEELVETLIGKLGYADLSNVSGDAQRIAAICDAVKEGFLAHHMTPSDQKLTAVLKAAGLKNNEIEDAIGVLQLLDFGSPMKKLRDLGHPRMRLEKYAAAFKAAGVWDNASDSGVDWDKLADDVLLDGEKEFLAALKEELESIVLRKKDVDKASAALPAAQGEFKCEMMSAAQAEELVKRIARHIRKDAPDVIVAVARGGLIPAALLTQELGGVQVISIQVTHWNRTGEKNREGAQMEYGLPAGSDLSGKKVLIIDDLTDTGDSLKLAIKEVGNKKPAQVQTATLLHKETSKFEPDYYGKKSEEWKWVVFPWNIREDFRNLRAKVDHKGMDTDQVLEVFAHELKLEADKKTAEMVFDGKADLSAVSGKHGLEADIIKAHATAEKMRQEEYVPDVIVGLGDAGLTLMMLFSDALDVRTVRHVPVGGHVENYLRSIEVEDSRVLIVGEFEKAAAANRLLREVWMYKPTDVKTAALKKTPEFTPDYYPTKVVEHKEPEREPEDRVRFFTMELLKWGDKTGKRTLISPVWNSGSNMLGRRNAGGEVVTATVDVLDGLIAAFKNDENRGSVIAVLQYLIRNTKDASERREILEHMKKKGQLKALKDTIRGFGDISAGFSYSEVYSWIMEPHAYKNINHVSVLQAMRKLEKEGLLVKDDDSKGAYRVPGDVEGRWAEARKGIKLDPVESLVLKTICVKRGLMLTGLFDGDVRDVIAGRGR